jgi:hypothetical protein
MAKTKVVTRKVDIVDLIRDRKLFPLLEVPPMRVAVEIEVTTTGLLMEPKPAPSAKLDRLEKAARESFESYEKTITEECERFSKKISDLLEQGKVKEAEEMAATVNTLVKNALHSAEGAALKAVDDTKKKEFQGDKLLTEARVKTAVKVTFAGVKLATSAVRLAGSHGADLHAYYVIAKTIKELGEELNQQLKGEPKLREDLAKGVDAYLKMRNTKVMEAAKANGLTNTSGMPGFPEVIKFIGESIIKTGKQVTKGKDAGAIAKDVLDFTKKAIAAQYQDVEKARQMYRNQTTIMRQKVDKISVKADELSAAMKKAPNLKQGVAIGAACMQVKGKVRALATDLEAAAGFLVSMETVMKDELGLKCDDRTIIDRLKAIDKSTIFTEGGGLYDNIKSVYELADAIKSAAGA